MRAMLARELRKAFDAAMARNLSPFARSRGMHVPGGAQAYVWKYDSELEFRVLLMPYSKTDCFNVELSWGKGPSEGWPLNYCDGVSLKPDRAFRLSELWGVRGIGGEWDIGGLLSSSPARSDSPTVSIGRVEEVVAAAVLRIQEYGLPYFFSVAQQQGAESSWPPSLP